jgi:hypothetical protein
MHGRIETMSKLLPGKSVPLVVSVRKPYGVETFYPECPCSKAFADLLRQKTFTRRDIENIKRLGYTIVSKDVEGVIL